MDLRKLRYFCAVVDAGSLHRASERLRVAQPALSKSMQALEAALGVKLLVRHSKGIETTEEGASLYRHAGEILAAWKAAEADVKEHARELGGVVSIGAPSALAQYLFGHLSSEIALVYPKLRLEFYEGVGHYLWDELHSERLDLAVIGDTEGSDSIISELITFEDVLLLRPNNTDSTAQICGVEDLLDHPLIVTTRAQAGRSWFEEITRHTGHTYDIRYRVESPQVAKDLVERGLGFAILPASGAINEIGESRFRVSRISQLKLPRVLACRKSRYLHPSVAFTRNLLRTQLRHLERAWPADS